MSGFSPEILLFIIGAYLVGSLVKGVTGFGAMLIAIPLMSMVIHPATAIALTSGPVLFSNGWQLYDSGEARSALRQFWPMLITIVPASIIGSRFTVAVDPGSTAGIIGTIVILFCLSRLFPIKLNLSLADHKFSGPVIGVLAGLINGATLLAGSVLIAYLVSLNLHKNNFVASIALIYLVATLPVYINLTYFGLYSGDGMIVSISLIFVAIVGLRMGRMIRDRVSQERFQKIVTVLLMCVGMGLLSRAF